MVFKGRVSIKEVEKDPVQVDGDEKDLWVQELLGRAAPQPPSLAGVGTPEEWAAKSRLKVDAELTMVGNDYGVRGHMEGSVPALCSRCAEPFMAPRMSDFQLYLHKNTGAEDHPDGPAEDPDYIFFSGEQIDLIDLLSEQLIVLEPIAEWPAKDAPGAACDCWNKPELGDQSSGQSPEKKAVSPFSKLQNLFKKED